MPVVAVVNTSEGIIELLRAVFQIEGFKVVSSFTLNFKRGTLNFDRFVEEHRPDAVVWDITIPYEANRALFKEIQASPAGQRCRFVLTSTNALTLQKLVSEAPVHEIIGKPYDLDVVTGAVRRAIGPEQSDGR